MQFSTLSFSFPYAFLLLGLVPLLIFVSLRSLSHLPRWLKVVSTAWRILVLMAFALVFAGPSVIRMTSRICVASLVDVSRSIPRSTFEATAAALRDLERSKPPGATLEHFIFAGKAVPLEGPGELERIQLPQSPPLDLSAGPGGRNSAAEEGPKKLQRGMAVDDRSTNIVEAVFYATSLLPQDCDRRIVLFTDGRDTTGEPAQLPSLLATAGVKVFPVVPAETKVSEVILEEMIAPPLVRTDAAFNVRVTLHSSGPLEAKLKLLDSFEGREPRLVEEKMVQLKEGTNTVTFEVKVDEEGKHLLRSEVLVPSMEELFLENNEFEVAVLAQGPPMVLYVEGEPRRGGPLRSALSAAGFKVSMEGPSALVKGNQALAQYDAVILSDVAYHSLPAGAFGKIKKYATGGGIFIFAGGKNSFQMGGYSETPFEPFLPVSMQVEKEVQKVSTAVILVIDKSGSMSGTPLEMAREAAKASVAMLDPETLVEVIVFDSVPRRLFQMQAAKNKMMINSLISQIRAGGGTEIIPALQMAYSDIVPVHAKRKHIVLLTDGQSSKVGLEALLAKAAGSNITISTIGLGTSVDRPFLEKIAVETGGKSYFTSNPKSLPRLLMQEMRVVTPPAVVEGVIGVRVKKTMPFIRKVGGVLPYLRGYNLTSAKGGRAATVLVSDKGDPLLAMWKQGEGWAVAFTSDVKARWGAPWVGWKNFGKFWAELIRSLSAKEEREEERGGKITVSQDGGRVFVSMDMIDETSGEFINGASGSGTVSRFQKGNSSFQMVQTAPGYYEGSFELEDYGAYFIGVEMKTPWGLQERAYASLNVPYPPEYRKIGADTKVLEEIARRTGGKLNASPGEVWDKAGSEVKKRQVLWPFIVLCLLLMIPIDIALRRIPF